MPLCGTGEVTERVMALLGLADPPRTSPADTTPVADLGAGTHDETVLSAVLDVAIRLTRADMGSIQIRRDGALHLVASRGFDEPFLSHFERVADEGLACGTAMASGQAVVVPDVASSPIFAGTEALAVMVGARALAVHSTPMVDAEGRVLGVVSTYYHRTHRPEPGQLALMAILAGVCADALARADRTAS